MTTVKCEVCDVEILKSNLVRHQKSLNHIKKSQPKIKADPKPNTIIKREQSHRVVDSVLQQHPNINIEELTQKLEERYAPKTIEVYLRLGYFMRYSNLWDKKTLRKNSLFLKDYQDKIASLDDEKEFIEIDITRILKDEKIPILIRLYMHMPIRAQMYADLLLFDTKQADEFDQSYIDMSTKTLYIINGKSVDYDVVKLDNATKNILDNPFFDKYINKNISLYNNVKAFQRELQKYTNTNTFVIRKNYANQYTGSDKYASRILSHRLTTHRGYYQR